MMQNYKRASQLKSGLYESTILKEGQFVNQDSSLEQYNDMNVE